MKNETSLSLDIRSQKRFRVWLDEYISTDYKLIKRWDKVKLQVAPEKVMSNNVAINLVDTWSVQESFIMSNLNNTISVNNTIRHVHVKYMWMYYTCSFGQHILSPNRQSLISSLQLLCLPLLWLNKFWGTNF